MGIIQGLLALVSIVASFFCFVLCAILIVLHPEQLLWFAPVTIGLTWWGWRTIKRATTVKYDHATHRHLMYPPGYFEDGSAEHTHLVEPMTPGGHLRHGRGR